MKLSRRSLIRAIPAVPMLAKNAQVTIEQLVGAQVVGEAADPISANSLGIHGGRKARSIVCKLFEQFGLPNWKQKQLRRRARESRTIDPDIAVLQSVSLRHKLEMQWRRNEQLLTERESAWLREEDERVGWLEKMGLDGDDLY